MKRTASAALVLLVLLAASPLGAQERNITGRVVSAETQVPLASVQVIVKGTSVGALTDAAGNYRLTVPAGAEILSFRSIGFRPAEAAISGTVVNIALSPDAVVIEGLVVTALGITREARSLGVAVQNVAGAELIQARETNIVNALSGRVSGVQITNAGPLGGSARIVIRGAGSLAGNNQPLFVIDGLPVDNSSDRVTPNGARDYGNTISDLNPEDIESITVLKGPNAAALYGSRAANGAVIVTTKTGRAARGLGITASTAVTFESPLRLPTYQNDYGQGSGGRFSFVDGRGGGIADGVDESWGPRLDGRLISQFFSNGEPVPWVPSPNNVRDFWELGRTVTSNVSAAASSDNANARFSLTRVSADGMMPAQELHRTSLALTGGAQLHERLSATGSATYTKAEGENRPGVGYGRANPMQGLTFFGRQVDIHRLKNYKDADGNAINWNYNYFPNPYWMAYENRNWDSRDRVLGNASLNYSINEWVSLTARSGTDWFSDRRRSSVAIGTLTVPRGAYWEQNRFQQEINSDVLISAGRDVSRNFNLSLNVGANRRDAFVDVSTAQATELSVPGVYNLGNAAVPPIINHGRQEKRVNSVLGSGQLGFRDFFFVDVTGRNDWSSTLPNGNNSYFYPSVSASLVFTDAVGLGGLERLLSFGKLRAGLAKVGNDADPYQLEGVYLQADRFGGTPAYTVGDSLPNLNLRPETTVSWELGTDLRFLNDRLGIDLTYYNAATTDQILAVQISPATGFTNRVLNAGQIVNKGVELLVNATPVQVGTRFSWEVSANYARNRSSVVELYGDLQTLVLGSFRNLNVEARVGEPYGTFFGNGFLRDDAGNIVVNANGLPIRDDRRRVLGNYNPDWIGGVNNRFRFGPLSASFLVDTRQGGQIYSATNLFGKYSGVLVETLYGREVAPEIENGGGFIVPGVKQNGQPNDIKVTAERYHKSVFSIHEPHIFDASFIKLREAKLGYAIPSSVLGRFGASSMDVALVGRNLWLRSKVPHIDPETAFDASNAQGFEFGQFPTARSIGFHINVTP
jgi:TonB-linked SusC/RagA family outer membrane protein